MGAQRHIRILPTHVANKIAAGEVVDRPASVAKELLENSIDAEATRIAMDIGAGGKTLIAVADNGQGMNRDDALLSIERQATSKISDVDDIEHITTLGFRGEALAAIASVSRFRLVTCERGSDAGTEIRISGGKIQDVSDVGAAAGTRIEVRDLFFNVPARRKFLRTHQTELSHVRMAFMVQALAHPDIGMTLTMDNRLVYELPGGGTLEDRLRDLFGRDYRGKLRAVHHRAAEMLITGYVSLPSFSRSDRGEQFVFVNGRAAGAPVIGYALREGYHHILPPDRQPCVFLFLQVDPAQVDVNVHPTKKEIRFRRSGDVRDALIHAIRGALGHPGGAAILHGAGPESSGGPAPGPRPIAGAQLTIENLPGAQAFSYPGLAPRAPTMPRRLPGGTPAETDTAHATPGAASAPWSWCRVVGQIGGLYVFLETEDGYVVMDPHAAHERVLFERFMNDVVNGKMETQKILMPEAVDLAPADAVNVRDNLDLLRQMGFGISEFGGDAFLLDALPSCFAGAAPGGILSEVARLLDMAGARGGKGRWREESIAQAACKSAVKARDNLTLREIEQLVVDLARTEMPYTCPHGRPTLIFTSFKELNKKFARE